MNLLILGGMSPRNKEYIRQAAKAFTPMFGKVMAHNYAHWQNAEAQMNLEQELVALQAKTRELGANYSIFAKSAGAVLSLKGIAKGVLQPKTALFAGLPLAFANGQNLPLNEWLIALNCPTIFVQNSHDPTASFAELERFLRQYAPGQLCKSIEQPGNTHDYTNFSQLKELLAQI